MILCKFIFIIAIVTLVISLSKARTNLHISTPNYPKSSQFQRKTTSFELIAGIHETEDESRDSVQLREFIPESVLHRRLPWTMKFLLKFFKNPLAKHVKISQFNQITTATTTTMSRVKLLFPFLDHPWIKPILQRLSPIGQTLWSWIKNNKNRFIKGAKVLAGIYFGELN